MEPIKYTLHEIPSGSAGIRATLKIMATTIKRYRKHPYIRELAMSLVADLPNKAYKREVQAIHNYVYSSIRYTRDIRGIETVQTPIQTIRLSQGDCDDHSVLVASLLESIGHKTRLVAVGFQSGHYSHVFAQTKVGPRWVAVETTENWPIGKIPDNIVSKMIHNI